MEKEKNDVTKEKEDNFTAKIDEEIKSNLARIKKNRKSDSCPKTNPKIDKLLNVCKSYCESLNDYLDFLEKPYTKEQEEELALAIKEVNVELYEKLNSKDSSLSNQNDFLGNSKEVFP